MIEQAIQHHNHNTLLGFLETLLQEAWIIVKDVVKKLNIREELKIINFQPKQKVGTILSDYCIFVKFLNKHLNFQKIL